MFQYYFDPYYHDIAVRHAADLLDLEHEPRVETPFTLPSPLPVLGTIFAFGFGLIGLVQWFN